MFVYETLLEASQAGETTIPHSAFRAQYEELCKQPEDGGPTKMEEQFKVIMTKNVSKCRWFLSFDMNWSHNHLFLCIGTAEIDHQHR